MSLHLSAKLLVQEIPEMNIPLAKKILGELEENRPTLAYVGNAAESGRVTGTLLAFNFAVSHKRI